MGSAFLGSSTRRSTTFVLAVLSVVALLAAAALLWGDDDAGVTSGDTSTTEATVPPPLVDTTTAVFPTARSGVTFDDPVEAARGFATDFVGFTDPVVGEFMQGDSRSGEVEIRALPTGPATTVFVRLLGEAWWVLGSASPDIDVTSPEAGAPIASPVALAGRSRAFEGTVLVEVRDDSGRTLARDFVTGGAGPEIGAFSGSVTFEPATTEHGTLLFTIEDADRGDVWEAGVLRIRFGDSVDVEAALVEAVEVMLAGGRTEDTWFSGETAAMLRGVVVSDDGAAVIDFADLRRVIPNASTSAGSAMLLEELDATVFGIAGVRSAEYRIEGSCSAFFEWLQMECHVRTP